MIQKGKRLPDIVENQFQTIIKGLKNLTPVIEFSVHGDIAEILTRKAEALISFTEEGARAFAEEAANNMREHIANFSVGTAAGRPHKPTQEFESHTGEKITGGGLYSGVGEEHYQDVDGEWQGRAGIGVGGAPVPRSKAKTKAGERVGDEYAVHVDRGTKGTPGRFVPEVKDIELWDIRDPTRRIKYHGIPSTWVPKFSKGHSEMAESWFAAKRKRALVKKGVRKSMGRYMQSADPQMMTMPFTEKRKPYKAHYPKYPVTSLGIMPAGKGGRIGLPFLGQDVYFGRSKTRRTREEQQGRAGSIGDIARAMEAELEDLKNMDATGLNARGLQAMAETSFEVWKDYAAAFGGQLRGYGGSKNILRSAGDVGHAVFSLDIRMATHILGEGNMAMLEHYPDNVGVKVSKSKGLGLRLNNSSGNVKGGDIGEHPGTPARRYIMNTAQHMRGWLEKILESGGMLKKGSKNLRITNQLPEEML